MDKKPPKVEVQGVPRAFDSTVQQLRPAPYSTQESQNGLGEFLNFEAKPNGLKEGTEEMETEQATEETLETTEEENVDVVFEVNGQKINASMSASMAQMLKESEEMRLAVIEKIMAEAENNHDQSVSITTAESSSRNTSATESADSPTVKTNPGVAPTPTSSTRMNGQTLGKRTAPTVISAENSNPSKVKAVTRGSVGIVKPKYEPKFVPSPTFRPNVQKASPQVGKAFSWDHKAIVSLIECYKSVNDRISAMGISKTVDLWTVVGKRMRARGFAASDSECRSKFATLTVNHPYSFKKDKKNSPPEKPQPWPYNKPLDNTLGDSSPAGKDKLVKKPHARAIPVITLEDDSPAGSDIEGLEDDDIADLVAKKAKLDTDTAAIDKFRRTYLRVETEKIKEMKAARAIQQEQCKLQKERNEILSSIRALLSSKNDLR